ncbi:Hypothetical predicted protein [Octopus vulgaris]|uniref:Uncharacterized protein n=1 Tax=Octopus vulgaris TaxID=6645 RepID=A0AA36F1W8_OCTVU|nr:Hypothetical predicted protein [Octopus vulgaris]
MLLQETSKQENDGLIASYNIELLVAKSGKFHTIGEALLHPVIEEVLSTIIHEKPDNIMKKILLIFFETTPLSASLMAARCDIYFLCDIFTKLNDLIKLLQGNRKTLIDCKSFITSFILKLMLYKTNLSKRQFHQFPQLDSLKDVLVDEDLATYRSYLQSLHNNTGE